MAFSSTKAMNMAAAPINADNNSITVINKYDNKDGLLYIRYATTEHYLSQKSDRFGKKTPYLKRDIVGMLTGLGTTRETKCHIAQNHNLEIINSQATIYDNGWEQQRSLQLKTSDNDIITIEAKDEDNCIVVKQNDQKVGYLFLR